MCPNYIVLKKENTSGYQCLGYRELTIINEIPTQVVVVVLLLFYIVGKHLRSCRDGQLTLTTLFFGRLRPPKRVTSTSCTYFSQ